MGILNITPDSFYDGGANNTNYSAVKKAGQMLEEGASFIDVGGYSSRPNAPDISVAQEMDRVLPVIEVLVQEYPDVIISIDTFRASVAEKAVQAGACMINDISAGKLDDTMLDTVAKLGVPYCMMHMQGNPQTMQAKASYEDICKALILYFSERLKMARAAGINDLIIDPGFGFAKTIEQNYALLNKLDLLQLFDIPVLAGLSRKSMIYKVLNTSAGNALNGTTALHMIALQKGAKILRAHDVAPAMECLTLLSYLS